MNKKKLLVKGLIVVLGYLVLAHIEHKSALDGYHQGCKDVIKEAVSDTGAKVSDEAVDSYCHGLANKYLKKK